MQVWFLVESSKEMQNHTGLDMNSKKAGLQACGDAPQIFIQQMRSQSMLVGFHFLTSFNH